MDIEKYFKEFDDANKAQDHYKMMAAMQKFFNGIHNSHENEVLSYYSLAQQFESLGMKSQPIKDAVIARVNAGYQAYPSTWKSTVAGLNALLDSDNRSSLKIKLDR